MPHPITFQVHHNVDDPNLPPWTVYLFPVNPDDAQQPSTWTAHVTEKGVTINIYALTISHLLSWAHLITTAWQQTLHYQDILSSPLGHAGHLAISQLLKGEHHEPQSTQVSHKEGPAL